MLKYPYRRGAHSEAWNGIEMAPKFIAADPFISRRITTMAEDQIVESLFQAFALRDPEGAEHTKRVVELTLQLAARVGMEQDQFIHVRRGALLHDIGKLGVPERILYKPGPLTPEEWEIVRQHPVYARDLLKPFEFLQPALEMPYGHHELWDGTGYPRGLKGEEIPLTARILAVVEVWDALRSDLPYRAAWEKERAAQYIREQSGRAFDPTIVDAFLEIVSGNR
jgi:HD-GYP domain-containing protein (c-di-GMP phosphodiesterase class II)